MMLRFLMGLWLLFSVASISMDGQQWHQEIDEQKLKSSGSYVLVIKDKKIYVLLGVRNKPGKNEDKTLSSFHGNVIRRDGIYDDNALVACKRNLAWELLMLNGDPKCFPEEGANEVLRQRQEQARQFLDQLSPQGMLKNSKWDSEQRPNFVFIVEYADVALCVEQFEKHAEEKAKNSKWPPEFNKLELLEVDDVITAIEDQIEQDPDKSIKYGQFTQCGNHAIYDACSRTIATSLSQFKTIAQKYKKDL